MTLTIFLPSLARTEGSHCDLPHLRTGTTVEYARRKHHTVRAKLAIISWLPNHFGNITADVFTCNKNIRNQSQTTLKKNQRIGSGGKRFDKQKANKASFLLPLPLLMRALYGSGANRTGAKTDVHSHNDRWMKARDKMWKYKRGSKKVTSKTQNCPTITTQGTRF